MPPCRLRACNSGWALGGLQIAFEDPVAEFTADREDASEEPAVDEALELHDAGEEELVLARRRASRLFRWRGSAQFESFADGFGDRLFAVDVVAGVDRAGDVGDAALGGLRVEVNGVLGIGECGWQGLVVQRVMPWVLASRSSVYLRCGRRETGSRMRLVPSGRGMPPSLADSDDGAHRGAGWYPCVR